MVKFIIPIRCFTCGSLVSDKWEDFSNLVKQGEDPGAALDKLGIKKYCCRRMLLSHIEIIDEVLEFSKGTLRKANR